MDRIKRERDKFVDDMIIQVNEGQGPFMVKKIAKKSKNELEFRTGNRRAGNGDLRLPNIEGFDAKEINAQGTLAAIKGGRNYLNNT